MHQTPHKILQYHSGEWVPAETDIIREQAVSLTVNNQYWLTFMCTPVDLEALAVGFLFNEEIIQQIQDLASVRVCPGEDNIDVWLNLPVKKPEHWIRTTGCSGGETSIRQGDRGRTLPKLKNGKMLTAGKIALLLHQLSETQGMYRKTGGVHTSAFTDGEEVFITAEDIGRHNTLDKLAGRLLLENIHPASKIILTTGRISSEMIQKAYRIGASVAISRTSPSSLSVRMAEELGLTLIGYARQEHFTVYTHPQRVLQGDLEKALKSEAA